MVIARTWMRPGPNRRPVPSKNFGGRRDSLRANQTVNLDGQRGERREVDEGQATEE